MFIQYEAHDAVPGYEDRVRGVESVCAPVLIAWIPFLLTGCLLFARAVMLACVTG